MGNVILSVLVSIVVSATLSTFLMWRDYRRTIKAIRDDTNRMISDAPEAMRR